MVSTYVFTKPCVHLTFEKGVELSHNTNLRQFTYVHREGLPATRWLDILSTITCSSLDSICLTISPMRHVVGEINWEELDTLLLGPQFSTLSKITVTTEPLFEPTRTAGTDPDALTRIVQLPHFRDRGGDLQLLGVLEDDEPEDGMSDMHEFHAEVW